MFHDFEAFFAAAVVFWGVDVFCLCCGGASAPSFWSCPCLVARRFLFFAYVALFANGTLSSLLLSSLTINPAVFLLFLIGAFGGWPGSTYDGGSVIARRIGDCCWDAVAVSTKEAKSANIISGGEPSSSVLCK